MMMITTYETTCWGQRYAVRADWVQASSPVQVRYEDQPWDSDPAGRQVADFRHRPAAALRTFILDGEDGGEDEADAAVSAMKEIED